MAYGERKARKPLDEFGLADKMGLGLASAGGIAVATFIDLTQSDDASALFIFNKWLTDFTSMIGIGDLPLYSVILILMAIGALSISFFQPVTLRGAFVQGFGLLAAIMTMSPSDLGAPLPGTMDDANEGGFIEDMPLPSGDDSFFEEEDVSYNPAQSPALAVPVIMMQSGSSDGYSVRIKVTFPDGLKEDITTMVRKGNLRGRLHNEANGRTYNLFLNSGGDADFRNDTLYIATRLPGTAPTTTLVARIEADGYRIKEERFEAKKGANPIWQINMDPGGGPLMIQRLNRPYTF
ncbi:MAG: hypothetical protein AAGA69_09400 [Pseudomonadota bacterium]